MHEDSVSVLLLLLVGWALSFLVGWGLGVALDWLTKLYWDWRWHRPITEEELAERLGVSREDLAQIARCFAEVARTVGIPAERRLAGLRE